MLGAMLVLVGSWVVLEVAVIALQRFGLIVWGILHLAWAIAFASLNVGLHGIALKLVDGEPAHWADLFGFFSRAGACSLAFGIYFAVVLIGLALLVAPGVWLAVRYGLFAHVLADNSLSGRQALHEAATLSSGRWAEVGMPLLVLALLNLAGTAFLGIGLLVTFPLSVLAGASLYRSLQRSAAV